MGHAVTKTAHAQGSGPLNIINLFNAYCFKTHYTVNGHVYLYRRMRFVLGMNTFSAGAERVFHTGNKTFYLDLEMNLLKMRV